MAPMAVPTAAQSSNANRSRGRAWPSRWTAIITVVSPVGTGLARGQRCWTAQPGSAAPRPVRWPSGRVGKRLPGRTRPHGPYQKPRPPGSRAAASVCAAFTRRIRRVRPSLVLVAYTSYNLPEASFADHGLIDAFGLVGCAGLHVLAYAGPPPDSAGRLRRVPPTYNRYVSSPFHTNTSVAIRTAE